MNRSRWDTGRAASKLLKMLDCPSCKQKTLEYSSGKTPSANELIEGFKKIEAGQEPTEILKKSFCRSCNWNKPTPM
jgi:uncharacterized protein YbaR (Trm112 family)